MIAGHLSAVVVDYFSVDALQRCVESLLDRSDVATDVVVVDNSGDGSSLRALAGAASRVRVIASERNLGFAAAANRGWGATRGGWIGFINPDVAVPPGALGKLVEYLELHASYAAAGPVLRGEDGIPQPFSHGGDPTPSYLGRRMVQRLFCRSLHDWGGGPTRDVDWVSGACLVARRSALERVGGFDERFFMYFEDVDWCRRCRLAGWRIAFVTSPWVNHFSSATNSHDARRGYYRSSLQLYYAKWYGPRARAIVRALQMLAH